MKAYVFPGQGSQFPGMGKDIFDANDLAKSLFHQADEILGFTISDLMFNGSPEDLKQTKVTQPAVFLHSVILAKVLGEGFKPDMVAGHSLGEISALVAADAMTFEDGLKLVSARAQAMQHACEINPSTMAAVLGLEDRIVEATCEKVDDIVVAANYNCPGQLVISGTMSGVESACEMLKEEGAKRALMLPVGGAFHSPLMEPAKLELQKAIDNVEMKTPRCPVYQNVNGKAVTDPAIIKEQLIAQLTAPVKWTQIMENMIADGASEFIEVGPGKVLQGLVKKVDREMTTSSAEVNG